MAETAKKIFPALKIKNGKAFLALGIAAGLLMIIFSSFGDGAREPPAAKASQDKSPDITAALEYTRELELRLEEIISAIAGVSEVKVLLTAEGAGEFIFAQRITDSENIIVFAKDRDRNEIPVIITESLPRIKGAAVVCKGGGSAAIKQDIISLVSATLGIPTNKIFVYN